MIRSIACRLIAVVSTLLVAVCPALGQGFIGPYSVNNWATTPPTAATAGGTLVGTARVEPGGSFILSNCSSGDGDWFNGTIPSNTPVSFSYRIRGYTSASRTITGLIFTGNNGVTFDTSRTFQAQTTVNGQFELAGTYSFTMPANEFTFGIRVAVRGGFSNEFATLEITNFNPGFTGGVALNALTPGQAARPAEPNPNELVVRYTGNTNLFALLTTQLCTASAIAPCTGTASFAWNFTGTSNGALTFARLEAYSELSCGTVTIPLVNDVSTQAPSFAFNGTVTALPIEAGRRFGIRAGGTAGSQTQPFSGTVRLSNFSACVPALVVPTPPCPGDADGNRSVTFLDITTVLANFGNTCP
jgi:hypothetical protein